MYEYTRLQTERLIIRPISMNDITSRFAYASDKEHVKYMVHMPDETMKDSEDFIILCTKEWEKPLPRFYEFAVILQGKHIGGVSIYGTNEQFTEGEIGWLLHRDYCGKGYATEAVKALVVFCNDVLHLSKLVADCDNRNIASMKVMNNIGMSLEYQNIPRQYVKRDERAFGNRFKMYL